MMKLSMAHAFGYGLTICIVNYKLQNKVILLCYCAVYGYNMMCLSIGYAAIALYSLKFHGFFVYRRVGRGT